MKRSLLLGCSCLFGMLAFAQEDPVLMRVNGKDILRSEFEYSYRRHAADTGTKLSPKEYAEHFAQEKLKVDVARALGLDTTATFRKQQEVFRTSLLESYLTDKQVMDSCARALYQKKGLNERNGRVQVKQIFKYLPQTVTSRHLEEEKMRMDSIYQVIKNQPNPNFTRLVELYSDDKHSRWIEPLQTTTEFETVAFSLPKGEISQPFFTPEGLHILKVIDRREMSGYEDVRSELTERLRRKEALDKGTEAVVERLKKAWEYTPNQAGINELLTKGETEQTLFTIDGQTYSGKMFRQFASSHPQAVKRQLNGYIAKSLLDYESRNLGKRHPEARYALQEFNENYLIEEVTKQKVTLPATNDRAGLATYFKFHSSDYRWEHPRYKGVIIHSVDKKTAKRAKKLLKKVPEKEWTDTLRQTFNTSGTEKIKVEQGIFADGDNKYIDKFVFKKGDYESLVSYPFTVVVGKKQKGPDDYREVIEQVRKDYRTYLDTYWKRELKESGKVEINQEVLKTVNNN
ncbi:peptidylprolyl isomerase [uncultured Bacteroides sp.]|uniref:peptidylprolyl isomerase n=1 Tax=uncultured Bacteroides sp. TaxID=162156 RepID=UPI0025DD3A32|nr:peptidylprolyl isomerase [uncultured Bacteroides sp.]